MENTNIKNLQLEYENIVQIKPIETIETLKKYFEDQIINLTNSLAVTNSKIINLEEQLNLNNAKLQIDVSNVQIDNKLIQLETLIIKSQISIMTNNDVSFYLFEKFNIDNICKLIESIGYMIIYYQGENNESFSHNHLISVFEFYNDNHELIFKIKTPTINTIDTGVFNLYENKQKLQNQQNQLKFSKNYANFSDFSEIEKKIDNIEFFKTLQKKINYIYVIDINYMGKFFQNYLNYSNFTQFEIINHKDIIDVCKGPCMFNFNSIEYFKYYDHMDIHNIYLIIKYIFANYDFHNKKNKNENNHEIIKILK